MLLGITVQENTHLSPQWNTPVFKQVLLAGCCLYATFTSTSKIFNKQSFGRMFVPLELSLRLIHQTDSVSSRLTTVYFPSRSKADVQGSLYEDQDTGENVAQVILAVLILAKKKPENRFWHAAFSDTTNYGNTCVYEPSFYVHTHTWLSWLHIAMTTTITRLAMFLCVYSSLVFTE